MSNTSKRIIISCGGTAGHFNPGLGIASSFVKAGGSAMLLIGGKSEDQAKQLAAAKSHGIDAMAIKSERRPGNPLKIPGFLLRLNRNISACAAICREYKADALLSMGCYASFPAAMGARRARVPLYIHDGNAKIGKANIFMSRFAKCAFLSFPAVNEEKLKCDSEVTGLPLRDSILEGAVTKKEAVEWLNRKYATGFDPGKPVILVFGGSLGAKTINEGISVNTSDPAVKDLQMIHLAGPDRAEETKKRYAAFPCKSLVLEACQDMRFLYSLADCVISRAGGSTISELAFFGKYAFLIPFPFAAEHHQDDNARFLCSGGGAEYVYDSECTPEVFREFISRFLANVDAYKEKGMRSTALSKENAADDITDVMTGSARFF